MKASSIQNGIVLLCLHLIPTFACADTLPDRLHAIYQASHFPGWSIAVVNRDGLVFEHHEGFADVAGKKPFTDQTVINIASVSKTFVAMAVMSAIDEGHFTLDTPINSLLPFAVNHPRFPDTPITVRHLVTHTSGIRDRDIIYYVQAYINDDKPGMSLETFMTRYFSEDGHWHSKSNFSKSRPGEAYAYSNIATALMAWIIEVKSGKRFSDYSTETTLKPLQMTQSGWHRDEIDEELHAVNYKKNNKVIKPYSLVTYPDGGMRSSTQDLSRYLTEIIRIYQGESAIFDNDAYRPMFDFDNTKNTSGVSEYLTGVGVFWALRTNGSIGHTGGDPGVSSFLFFSPETGTGQIFLTNVDIKNDKQNDQFRLIWGAVREAYP